MLDGIELEDIELVDVEPTTQVALAVDEVAYLRGWTEAMQTARDALCDVEGPQPDELHEGWLDAVTQQPLDHIRLAASPRYARGHAAGIRAYRLVQRGGCDAE